MVTVHRANSTADPGAVCAQAVSRDGGNVPENVPRGRYGDEVDEWSRVGGMRRPDGDGRAVG